MNKLSEIFAEILTDPAVVQSLQDKGLIAMPMNAQALQKTAQEDSDRWGAVIKKNNISF